MEQESYSSGEERIYVSSLPVDRWVKLALGKLTKGYFLIVGDRTAHFFQRGRGYEPCPMPVAKLLVKEGIVVESGAHDRGRSYELAVSDLKGWSLTRVSKVRDEEDEEEMIGAEEDSIGVEDTDDADESDESDESDEDEADGDEEEGGDEPEEEDPLFG